MSDVEKLAREADECIEALKDTDLMVYIDENDDARQLVNFTAPNLARAVLEQTREIKRQGEEIEALHIALRASGERREEAESRVRQMEEALFKLRNLIFVLDDSATDMGAEYLVDTENYERLLDAAREPGWATEGE